MLRQILFLAILLPSIVLAQHAIKGTFSPTKDFKYALLYKVNPTKSVYITNTEIKEDGNFLFQLDSTATSGMYRIVYAVPQEDYNFDVIYNSKEDIELTYNPESGVNYLTSIENKLVTSYTNSMSMISQSIAKFYKVQSKDSTALEAIFKTQRETQANFEAAAKGTIALHFIKANRPYIPNHFEDVNVYIKNLETHFFDDVDFNNEVLQSSSFLNERMFNYVFGMSTKDDEVATLKKNIDVFYQAMTNAPVVIKSSLLIELWQQMVDANFEDVANYISDKYLMEIAKALNDQELINGLVQFKKTSINSIAPDFSLDGVKDGKKLSELNISNYYIIVFWSSTCSHCLQEIPQLETYIKSLKKEEFHVIAVGLEDDATLWNNKIKDFPDFIHILGLGKWDNEIGNNYNVSATPTYFVLDKDKHIIAKPESIEALKTYFETK